MYVILYVRSIVFIINAAFLYINWARLIVLYPVIYYLLEIKEPSYISQTLYVLLYIFRTFFFVIDFDDNVFELAALP